MWTPIQLVNLKWVPLPYRVLYMNITVMLWTIYLADKLNRDKEEDVAAAEKKGE